MNQALQSTLFKSIYVHFPFCEVRCHYCDFYSIASAKAGLTDRSEFLKGLKKETMLSAESIAPNLDTVFLGGGTPSMTPPEDMASAMKPIFKRLCADTEFTMEANPSSLSKKNLPGYIDLGVNRVSLGIQSTDENLLKKLGRVHDREGAFSAIELILKSGIANISVDLICGIPGQSLATLERSLEELTAYPISHLSCYLLTLPKTHWLYPELPNEDEQVEHLMQIHEFMNRKGFLHYEISNYCRPGLQAKHNMNYWQRGSYLGLGPSAHSFDSLEKRRTSNAASLKTYCEKLSKGIRPIALNETLEPDQENLEAWMLALRLEQGFSKAELKASKVEKADRLIENGLLQHHPVISENLRLTPLGMTVSDQVIAELA